MESSSGASTSLLRGQVGAALLPGHPYVYDRSAGDIVACNATLCPHAQYAAASGSAAQQWVSRSPYFGDIPWGG